MTLSYGRRTESRVCRANEKKSRPSQTFIDHVLNEIRAEIIDEDAGQFRFNFDETDETEIDPNPSRNFHGVAPINGAALRAIVRVVNQERERASVS